MNMKIAFNLAKTPAKMIYERLKCRLGRTTLSIPEDARAVGHME
jgi:hypothetical protein